MKFKIMKVADIRNMPEWAEHVAALDDRININIDSVSPLRALVLYRNRVASKETYNSVVYTRPTGDVYSFLVSDTERLILKVLQRNYWVESTDLKSSRYEIRKGISNLRQAGVTICTSRIKHDDSELSVGVWRLLGEIILVPTAEDMNVSTLIEIMPSQTDAAVIEINKAMIAHSKRLKNIDQLAGGAE
ncbi:hypothetical protein [Solemya velum gill symbiont]|nr:hypothetical protein [Solemya velum gill symbiont]OOY37293.1 hypothetical protein BOV89_07795 [Solemya velum gill symbiont]OOY67271.1 hypothetical protein BOW06_07200 [Solemya velum gill symbiont]OOY94011.1 hypothetical protein BOW18_12095 [Solemya velum gill symbiont]